MERNKIHVTDSIIMDFIVDFCDILVMVPMALFDVKMSSHRYGNTLITMRWLSLYL